MKNTKRRHSGTHQRVPDHTEDESVTETDELEGKDKKPVKLLVNDTAANKWKSFSTRAIWSIVMVAGFSLIIAAGHFYAMLLVLALKIGIFKEILSLKVNVIKDKKLPYFRTLNWYFFSVAIYFSYGSSLKLQLANLANQTPAFEVLSDHHMFKSFSLYIIGFVVFVMTLRPGMYKYQFSQFGWTHLVLMLVVMQASCMISNIYAGFIWFFLPCGLIIFNDIMAYIFGFFFGRTPLISLSPKKTWEGFIGALFSTLLFALVFAWALEKRNHMTCPQSEITLRPFMQFECEREAVFLPKKYTLPASVAHVSRAVLGSDSFEMLPIQLHAVSFAGFAAAIAPFGGFFASGFKRAFKIKDFGDSIPGHGGVTDRMDCQIMMSMFVYVYRFSFLNPLYPKVAWIMGKVAQLTAEDQLDLYRRMTEYLGARGILP